MTAPGIRNATTVAKYPMPNWAYGAYHILPPFVAGGSYADVGVAAIWRRRTFTPRVTDYSALAWALECRND